MFNERVTWDESSSSGGGRVWAPQAHVLPLYRFVKQDKFKERFAVIFVCLLTQRSHTERDALKGEQNRTKKPRRNDYKSNFILSR
jgi:hypothetical protein